MLKLLLPLVLTIAHAQPPRAPTDAIAPAGPAAIVKTALITPKEATDARIDELARAGFGTIVFPIAPEFVTLVAERTGDGEWVTIGLDSHSRFSELFVHTEVGMGRRTRRLCLGFRDGLLPAAARVRARGLRLGWWFEVGRQPALADALPGLVASLQGNPHWRRLFRDTPIDDDEHVVKCWPWLPVTSREGLVLHQAWICSLGRDLPPADVVFLNDLQGGPSACGCGNLQCRWISDYGEKRTTTPAEDDAAAQLVKAAAAAFTREVGPAGATTPVAPGIVPVWTSECEKDDAATEGHCAGVSCFDGACWRTMWNQLDPVAELCPAIGLMLLTKTFGRSGADDRAGAGWIGPAVAALGAADERRAGAAITANRIIAVIESAGRDAEVVEAELAAVEQAGVRSAIVVFGPLEQGFEPRLVPFVK